MEEFSSQKFSSSDTRNSDFSDSARQLFLQIKILCWKNYLLFSRQYITTLILIFSPFLVCLYLVGIQTMSESLLSRDYEINPSIKSTAKIPKCWGKDCETIRFWISGENKEWSDYVIDSVAKDFNLKIGKDVKVSKKPEDFGQYFYKNMNKTKIGVVLCTDAFALPKNELIKEIPCQNANGFSMYLYNIMYNLTEASMNMFDKNAPDPLDQSVISVKIAIDRAILKYNAKIKGIENPNIEASLQSFPKAGNRFVENYDCVSMVGPMLFFIPPLLIFGMIVSEIVKEKELKLRHGLAVMGVSSSAFWISWWITAFIISLLSTNVLIFSAYLFDFNVFINSPYLIQLMNFELFTLSMLMLGFCLSTILKSVKVAYTISYTFLLTGIVMQSILESYLIIQLIHVKELPSWTYWIRWFFSFYPGYNFSKIYNDIGGKAGGHPNFDERRFEEGKEYSMEDFSKPRTGYINGYEYYIKPSIDSMYDQIFDFFLFIVLAWYFDHILSSNRGKSDQLWFMFTKEYWGCKRRVKKQLNKHIEMVNIKESILDDSIEEIKEKTEGLRIEGIYKTYKKGIFSSSEDIEAVKPINLSIEKDELLVLIGHNGAGKTTLLSMLTGLLSPSGGTAYISNYDISHDMNKIYGIMGYCPQFDILWNELTGYEHLKIFSIIKNIPENVREKSIWETLKNVNLEDAANLPVGKYSGGMKRRLSVAISDVGNPLVIFMDEPTTGMDPISKRFVWKLIKNMKKDKVVVLTTHSMEEAEVLADKIAVMVDGRIKCIGTSLYLKNTFGEGYKVEVFSKDTHKLWSYIKSSIPNAHMVDNSGGSLVISISRNLPEEALKLYKMIEEDHKISELIENWGLSNSSLEEVFMRVTEKIHHYNN